MVKKFSQVSAQNVKKLLKAAHYLLRSRVHMSPSPLEYANSYSKDVAFESG